MGRSHACGTVCAQADWRSIEQQEGPTGRVGTQVLNAERKLQVFLGDLRWSLCYEIRKAELGNSCVD